MKLGPPVFIGNDGPKPIVGAMVLNVMLSAIAKDAREAKSATAAMRTIAPAFPSVIELKVVPSCYGSLFAKNLTAGTSGSTCQEGAKSRIGAP